VVLSACTSGHDTVINVIDTVVGKMLSGVAGMKIETAQESFTLDSCNDKDLKLYNIHVINYRELSGS